MLCFTIAFGCLLLLKTRSKASGNYKDQMGSNYLIVLSGLKLLYLGQIVLT